jgi:hypothetical protein
MSPPITKLEVNYHLDSPTQRSLPSNAGDVYNMMKLFPGLETFRTEMFLFMHLLTDRMPIDCSKLRQVRLDDATCWRDCPQFQEGREPRLLNPSFPALRFVDIPSFWPGIFGTGNGMITSFSAHLDPAESNVPVSYPFGFLKMGVVDIIRYHPRLERLSMRDFKILELPTIEDRNSTISDILRPLFTHSRLQDLDIFLQTDISLWLSDDGIDEMAKGCPSLCDLSIGSSSLAPKIAQFKPTLSPSCIFSLLNQCPQLRSITLSLNTPTWEVSKEYKIQDRPFHLDRLDFGNSWISDHATVADWVSKICLAEGVFWRDWVAAPERSQMFKDMKLFVKHLQSIAKKEETLREEMRSNMERLEAEIEVLRRENAELKKSSDTIDVKPSRR